MFIGASGSGKTHDLSSDARGVSVGQQHRLPIARCLAMGPEVILLDEPTASLDPDATAVIEALMLDLAQDHTLILVLTGSDGVSSATTIPGGHTLSCRATGRQYAPEGWNGREPD